MQIFEGILLRILSFTNLIKQYPWKSISIYIIMIGLSNFKDLLNTLRCGSLGAQVMYHLYLFFILEINVIFIIACPKVLQENFDGKWLRATWLTYNKQRYFGSEAYKWNKKIFNERSIKGQLLSSNLDLFDKLHLLF